MPPFASTTQAGLIQVLGCSDRNSHISAQRASLLQPSGLGVVIDLSAFGWDSDEELVTLEAAHISAVLNRFLSGDISDTDVEDWANAIECREDIGFPQGSAVAGALDELANPLLTRPLTRQSAAELVAALSGAAT